MVRGKKRSSDERSDRRGKLPDKQYSKVVEEAENCVELPLQCITFDLEGDLLALLLLVYIRHSQKHHINFDVIEKKTKKNKTTTKQRLSDAHFKGLV